MVNKLQLFQSEQSISLEPEHAFARFEEQSENSLCMCVNLIISFPLTQLKTLISLNLCIRSFLVPQISSYILFGSFS